MKWGQKPHIRAQVQRVEWSIRFVPKKIFGRKFCGKKRSGRINPRGRMHEPHPHPEKSRVKIVLGCC